MSLSKPKELPFRPKKVLVVDDAVESRFLLTEVLKTLGVQVDCACNGKEALAYLNTHELPSLIILDLHMPVMDGREFYQHQKNDVRFGSIPVLLYTAALERETEFCPRSQCLSKDVSLEQLIARIEALLRGIETVLIVDDNWDLLCCLRHSLEQAGFQVVQAPSAFDAMEYLKGEEIDVLVTDLEMPGMNGLDLIKYVRNTHPRVAVALMSGWSGLKDETADLVGVDAFFSKPEVLTELASFLRTRRKV